MLTSALPLAFIGAAIVVLGATGHLFSASPLVIAVQLAAVGLNVWARASFAKGTFRVGAAPAGASLMRNGPYRLVRHPMYAAVVLLVWAGIAGHPSAIAVAIGAAVTAVAILRVMAEDRLLLARFADYRQYAATTKALVPFVF